MPAILPLLRRQAVGAPVAGKKNDALSEQNGSVTFLEHWQLRARFALGLSELYGGEVPSYATLVEVAAEVNRDFQWAHPHLAERLGSIDRVTAERHGAIRVGSARELAQVARVFGALGMKPVGFYDLRDAKPKPIPVVSTAFRPIDRAELARNPFRVFTSMLVPEDRRFFSKELQARLVEFIEARTLFPDELLALADASIRDGGLTEADAERYLGLATAAFALSDEPVDRAWYDELDAISSVAADIGGVTSTHINHLTPRVLDIDDLYGRMSGRGIEMIDAIQGPPRWGGPDVLLRQTSFRALAEPRVFREADGSVGSGDLRVRFGEVEARGIALTPAGRDHYDWMVQQADDRASSGDLNRADAAANVWAQHCPPSERELLERDYAYFNFTVPDGAVADGAVPVDAAPLVGWSTELLSLIDTGMVVAEPIVYEDFLPRSAAGIFASNLSSVGSVDSAQGLAARDTTWMSEQIGIDIQVPYALYFAERAQSFERAMVALGLSSDSVTTPWDVPNRIA